MRWLARGEIELPADDAWLSEREREQVATIRFTKRRQEYLTRRWTAKHAIAEALALGPADGTGVSAAVLATIEVRNHPSGAPWVAVDGAAAGVEVSLTDRAGWAVCLVGRPAADDRLGIDLELVEPRSAGFVTDYLTPAEQAHVAAQVDDDGRHVAANALWSAKEAALKVLQVGLRADTRTVEVTLHPDRRSDGWAELTIRGRDGDRFHGWWRRDGEFVLTLATRDGFDPPERSDASADLATAAPSHAWLDAPIAGRPGA
jgi:4'-phosphopantetheinyl transferase